jgi:hypothetical protein
MLVTYQVTATGFCDYRVGGAAQREIAEMRLGRLQLHRRPVNFEDTVKRAPHLESKQARRSASCLHTLWDRKRAV